MSVGYWPYGKKSTPYTFASFPKIKMLRNFKSNIFSSNEYGMLCTDAVKKGAILAKRKDDKNYLQIRGKTSGLVFCLPEGGAAVVIVGKHLQKILYS
jgi:hypothetical protein